MKEVMYQSRTLRIEGIMHRPYGSLSMHTTWRRVDQLPDRIKNER